MDGCDIDQWSTFIRPGRWGRKVLTGRHPAAWEEGPYSDLHISYLFKNTLGWLSSIPHVRWSRGNRVTWHSTRWSTKVAKTSRKPPQKPLPILHTGLIHAESFQITTLTDCPNFTETWFQFQEPIWRLECFLSTLQNMRIDFSMLVKIFIRVKFYLCRLQIFFHTAKMQL